MSIIRDTCVGTSPSPNSHLLFCGLANAAIKCHFSNGSRSRMTAIRNTPPPFIFLARFMEASNGGKDFEMFAMKA